MGLELKGAFVEAGFVEIVASISTECFSSDEDIEFILGQASDGLSGQRGKQLLELGLADQEEIDQRIADLDEWKSHPGAIVALAWGEAIARKPG